MPDSPNVDRPGVEPAESVEYRTAEYAPTRPADEFAFDSPDKPGEIGRLGPYRVIRELGRGGMGAVFLGYDERLGRPVALKVMLPKFALVEESKVRFLKEARAAAKLTNDHIVTVYEANIYNGTPCIAMQLLQGQPLDQYLKTAPRPDLTNVLRIGKEIANGLAAAHEAALVHRDIKPANIWIESPNLRVKILDFGLAKQASNQSHSSGESAFAFAALDHTATGTILGTPLYMSPEQARGEPVDFRSDLYSLGVVLYRMSTGTMPFGGGSMPELLLAIINDSAKPVREINPALPASFSNLVERLMRKRTDQRPSSARRVALELQHIDQEVSSPWEAIAPSADHLLLAISAYGAGKSFAEIADELWEQGVYRSLIPDVLMQLAKSRADSQLRVGLKPTRIVEQFVARGLNKDDAIEIVNKADRGEAKERNILRAYVLGLLVVGIAGAIFDFSGFRGISGPLFGVLVLMLVGGGYFYFYHLQIQTRRIAGGSNS